MELLLREDKPTKRPSLLRRLSSNISLSSWKGEDDTPATKEATTAQKSQSRADRPSTQHQHQEPHTQPTFGSMVEAIAPRWTPPLSPSSKSTKHSSSFSSGDTESQVQVLSPRDALKVLNSPGVPPLDDLRQMRILVGGASRPWLRDFLIRGGRRCVNAKVNEMSVLEKEAKKRRKRVPLIPKVFTSVRKNSNGNGNGNGNGNRNRNGNRNGDGRVRAKARGKGEGNSSYGLLPRPTLREIAEAREELMKIVVFLHLRE